MHDYFSDTISQIIKNRTYQKIERYDGRIFPIRCINTYRKDTNELVHSIEYIDFKDDDK